MLRRSPRLLLQAVQKNKSTPAKAFSSMKPEVIHDKKNGRFYIQIGNDKAFLLYDKYNSIVDLYETKVPVAFRGKGIAEILAKAAFDHVVKSDLKMRISCSYLQSYLEKHPTEEYKSRVVD